MTEAKLRRQRRSMALIPLLLLTVILQIVSLGDFMDLNRPDFPVLILIYFAASTGSKLSLELSWITGIIIDLLYGAPLGINALILTAQVYLVISQFANFRVYTIWQQALITGIINLIVNVICFWLAHMMGQSAYDINFLVPALLMAALWFPVRICLDMLIGKKAAEDGSDEDAP